MRVNLIKRLKPWWAGPPSGDHCCSLICLFLDACPSPGTHTGSEDHSVPRPLTPRHLQGDRAQRFPQAAGEAFKRPHHKRWRCAALNTDPTKADAVSLDTRARAQVRRRFRRGRAFTTRVHHHSLTAEPAGPGTRPTRVCATPPWPADQPPLPRRRCPLPAEPVQAKLQNSQLFLAFLLICAEPRP